MVGNDDRSADATASDIVAYPSKVIASSLHTTEGARFIETYWALQRHTGKLVPPRQAFNPSLAKSLLPHMGIIEVREPRLALIRLVGTGIVNRTRINNTGRNLMERLPAALRETTWQHLTCMINTPCGSAFLSKEANGYVSALIETVCLPLADTDGTARFIFSVSTTIDRQQLARRDEQEMQIAEQHDYRFIDISDGLVPRSARLSVC